MCTIGPSFPSERPEDTDSIRPTTLMISVHLPKYPRMMKPLSIVLISGIPEIYSLLLTAFLIPGSSNFQNILEMLRKMELCPVYDIRPHPKIYLDLKTSKNICQPLQGFKKQNIIFLFFLLCMLSRSVPEHKTLSIFYYALVPPIQHKCIVVYNIHKFHSYLNRKRTARTSWQEKPTAQRIPEPTRCRTGSWWCKLLGPGAVHPALPAKSATNQIKISH